LEWEYSRLIGETGDAQTATQLTLRGNDNSPISLGNGNGNGKAKQRPTEPGRTPEMVETPPSLEGPLVVLRDRVEGPKVLGKTKRKLTTPQYNVVRALLDAGDAGLTKDELVSKSLHEDARGILKRLADSDPDWKKVIHFAGRTGGRYRIK